jgi:putative FmdB family regulatory protein
LRVRGRAGLAASGAATYTSKWRSSLVPLYEYVCKRCSHPFEELTSSDAVAAPCPKCAATDTERVPLSRVAVGKASSHASVDASPCGRCGDPRGPGACGLG